jgi:hypothetical protein
MATQEMINIQSQISKLQEQQKNAPPPMKDVFQQQINTLKSAADALSKQQASTPKPTPAPAPAPALVYSGGHWVSPTASTPTPAPAIQIGTAPIQQQINKAVAGPMVASGQISTPTPTQPSVSIFTPMGDIKPWTPSVGTQSTSSPVVQNIQSTPLKQPTMPNILETALYNTSPLIASQVYQQRTGEVAPFSPTTAITKQQVSAPFIQTIPVKTTQNIANPIIPKTFSDFISEKSNQEMKTMTAPITYSGSPTLLKQVPKSTEWNWGDAFNTTIGAVGNVGKGITDTVGGALGNIQKLYTEGATKSYTGYSPTITPAIKKDITVNEDAFVGPVHPDSPDFWKSSYKTYNKDEGISRQFMDSASNIDSANDAVNQLLNFDKTVNGEDVIYKVPNFQSVYLYGHDDGRTGQEVELTADEYETYAHNLGKDIQKSIEGVDSGSIRMLGYSASREWKPNTKVYEYDPYYFHIDEKTGTLGKGQTSGVESPGTKAFFDSFEYHGAENYGSYRKALEKSDFGGLLATAFTPQDPLGLASAYYTATGDKEKGVDVKIKAMQGVADVKEAWKQGPSLNALNASLGWYASMPLSQIAISAVSGGVVGKGLGYATKVLPRVATAGKIIGLGAGAYLGYEQGKQMYGQYERGEYGELLGGLVSAGLTMYAGAKTFQEGNVRGQQLGERTKILSTIKDPAARYAKIQEFKTLDNLTSEWMKLPKDKRLVVNEIIGLKDAPPSYTPSSTQLPISNVTMAEAKLLQKALTSLQSEYKVQLSGSASQYIATGGKTRLAKDMDLLVGQKKIGVQYPSGYGSPGYQGKNLGTLAKLKLQVAESLGLKNKSRVDAFKEDALKVINTELGKQGQPSWDMKKLSSLIDVHDRAKVGSMARGPTDVGYTVKKGFKSGIIKDVTSASEQVGRKMENLIDPLSIRRGKDIPDFFTLAKLQAEAHPILGKGLNAKLSYLEKWTPQLEEGGTRFPVFRTPKGRIMYKTGSQGNYPEGIAKPGTSYWEQHLEIAPTAEKTAWQSYLFKRGIKAPTPQSQIGIPDVGGKVSTKTFPEMAFQVSQYETYTGPPIGISGKTKSFISAVKGIISPKNVQTSIPRNSVDKAWSKLTDVMVGEKSVYSGANDDLVFHWTNPAKGEGVTLTKAELSIFKNIEKKLTLGKTVQHWESEFYNKFKPISTSTVDNKIAGMKAFLSKNPNVAEQLQDVTVTYKTPILGKKVTVESIYSDYKPSVKTSLSKTSTAPQYDTLKLQKEPSPLQSKPIQSEPSIKPLTSKLVASSEGADVLPSKPLPSSTSSPLVKSEIKVLNVNNMPTHMKNAVLNSFKRNEFLTKPTRELAPDEFYHGTSNSEVIKYGLIPEKTGTTNRIFLTKNYDVAEAFTKGTKNKVIKVKLTPEQLKHIEMREYAKDYEWVITEKVSPSQLSLAEEPTYYKLAFDMDMSKKLESGWRDNLYKDYKQMVENYMNEVKVQGKQIIKEPYQTLAPSKSIYPIPPTKSQYTLKTPTTSPSYPMSKPRYQIPEKVDYKAYPQSTKETYPVSKSKYPDVEKVTYPISKNDVYPKSPSDKKYPQTPKKYPKDTSTETYPPAPSEIYPYPSPSETYPYPPETYPPYLSETYPPEPYPPSPSEPYPPSPSEPYPPYPSETYPYPYPSDTYPYPSEAYPYPSRGFAPPVVLPTGVPSPSGGGGSQKYYKNRNIGYKERKHDVALIGVVTQPTFNARRNRMLPTSKFTFSKITKSNVQPYPSMNEYTPSKSTTRPSFFKIA